MALPVGPEDLQKLKSFIDFVSMNPTILNFPQLAFVKEFIEKFGGKVPSGEYKTPGGGGCPFGGAAGVKTEPKHAEPDTDPEPEEAEMESDSESELELDLEVEFAADNERGDSNSTNAVYLQESTDHKKKGKGNKKRRITLKSEKTSKEKQEEPSSEDEAFAMDMAYDSCDESDPIDTAAEVLIKTETDFEEHLMEPLNEQSDEQEDNSYEDDGSDTIDSDVELSKLKKIRRQKKVKPKRNTRSKKSLKSSDDKDFWQSIYKKSKKKQPKTINCTDKCKHKCHTLNISETQRRAMCAEYWALNKEERKSFLLSYIESRHISKIRAKKSTRPTRGYTNCYFLKNNDGEKVRVCLSFFQRTFCIPNSAVKMATDNRDVNDLKKSNARKFLTLKEKKDLQEREGSVASNPNDAIVFQVTTEGQEDANRETKQAVLNADGSVNATQATVQSVRPPHPMKGRKFKKDRLPQPVNCDAQCIMKCTKNFTDLQRTQICQHFWTMDYKRQKDFVLSKIETREVESLTAQEYRTSTRAQRTFSNRYFFRGPNGNNVRVCAKFFMATLCIGRHVINNARKYCDRQTGSYAGEDRRGKRTPGNKIPDVLVDDMKRFIESYPTWVPHKNYKTRFLHSSLSIQQMWRDYKKLREGEGRKYCSASFFRHTFHKDFRLAFLKPTSKHAQRVSAMKKDVFLARTEQKKANVNISDYTGEEGGGFWIKPSGEAADHGLGFEAPQAAQASDPAPLDQPEPLAAETKHNVLLHIQENVQLSAPQQSMLPQHRMNPTDYYTAINYAPPMSGSDHSHGIPSLSIHNFMASRFDDENPAVFRML